MSVVELLHTLDQIHAGSSSMSIDIYVVMYDHPESGHGLQGLYATQEAAVAEVLSEEDVYYSLVFEAEDEWHYGGDNDAAMRIFKRSYPVPLSGALLAALAVHLRSTL